MLRAKDYIEKLLESADIRIDGNRPWDMQIHNKQLFNRVFRNGSLGLGESYMDGWWDADQLDQFFYKLLKADLDSSFKFAFSSLLLHLHSFFVNQQSKKRSFIVGKRHYDIGNDLYEVMLDRRMVYTCAYWPDTDNLDQAQEAKLDLVCRKLDLKPGHRVLDIGCGWGSFARYAAETRGVEVVGITISEKQVELGRELCRGLPVEIRLMDYREIDESFDHIVSLGMLEHVGEKNYRNYFDKVSRSLSGNGLFLLQTIGSSVSVRNTDPWINKYIFPNSMIPSIAQIGSAMEGRLVMEDWQNFGADYDKTLMAWFRNFQNGWDSLKSHYSHRFFRMWKYFLLMSAGSFRARKNQLWQIVLSKSGIPEGYSPPRYRRESGLALK